MMTYNKLLISILIPTCNRPRQLCEAIQSCFEQQYRPLELVISDDSTSDATERLVAKISCPDGITIRYVRNRLRLGQSGNVNALFAMATGPRLMLLHDDDFIWPNALDRLNEAWKAFPDPVCVYGKQVVVSEDGAIAIEKSLELNKMYYRSEMETSVQQPSEAVGLLQQIPNNGYLVETSVARAVGYRSESEVGHSVDSDFGIRFAIAAAHRQFVFVNDYISAYRINNESIAHMTDRNQDMHLLYSEVERLDLSAAAEVARQVFLDRNGAAAVLDAANAGDRLMACRILFSRHFRKSFISAHGLLALFSIASQRAGAAVRPYCKSLAMVAHRFAANMRERRGAMSASRLDMDGNLHLSERLALEAMIERNRSFMHERRTAVEIIATPEELT